ncbi:hypothetical protein HMPREF1580_01309, partial [Gardnerella vaginalis JCP8070]
MTSFSILRHDMPFSLERFVANLRERHNLYSAFCTCFGSNLV